MAPSTRKPNPCTPLPGRNGLEHRGKQVLESPLVWIADKAQADQELYGVDHNLWAVHGVLYDLTSFAANHPGGREWIDFTRGSDVTDLFETHHLDEAKATAMLKKYMVRKAPESKTSSRFDWSEEGLYKTLKRRVAAKLGKDMKQHGPTTGMKASCAFLLVSFLGCFFAACMLDGIAAVGCVMLAGSFLHSLLGVGHNFFHQANNPWMHAFDLTLFSSHHWRISHAISHHHYANLEMDTEVSSLEPFLYFLSNKPRNSVFVYVSFHLILALASTLDFVRHVVACITSRGLVESFRPENGLVILEACLLIAHHGTKTGLLLFFLMQATASWLLAALSFSVHRTEHHWTEGDENAERDFAKHILATTTDHSVSLPILPSLYLFAGLNYHVTHHLFPTLDISRLKEVEDVVDATCAEFQVERRKFDFFTLWRATFRRHDMALF